MTRREPQLQEDGSVFPPVTPDPPLPPGVPELHAPELLPPKDQHVDASDAGSAVEVDEAGPAAAGGEPGGPTS